MEKYGNLSWHIYFFFIHPLSFCESPRSSKSYLYNHCGKSYLKSDLSYYSTLCDFDICMKCYKIFKNEKNKRGEENKLKTRQIPKNGFKFQISGVHDHPLTQCNVRKGINCNENVKNVKLIILLLFQVIIVQFVMLIIVQKCFEGRGVKSSSSIKIQKITQIISFSRSTNYNNDINNESVNNNNYNNRVNYNNNDNNNNNDCVNNNNNNDSVNDKKNESVNDNNNYNDSDNDNNTVNDNNNESINDNGNDNDNDDDDDSDLYL